MLVQNVTTDGTVQVSLNFCYEHIPSSWMQLDNWAVPLYLNLVSLKVHFLYTLLFWLHMHRHFLFI